MYSWCTYWHDLPLPSVLYSTCIDKQEVFASVYGMKRAYLRDPSAHNPGIQRSRQDSNTGNCQLGVTSDPAA